MFSYFRAKFNSSSAAGWSVIDSLIQSILSLGIFLFFARTLSVEIVGIGILCFSVYQIANLPAETLFHDAVVQKQDLSSDDIASAHAGSLLTGLICAASMIAATAAFPGTLSGTGLLLVMNAFAVAIVANSIAAVPLALNRRKLLFKKIALVQGGARLLANIMAASVALNGFGVWAFAAQQALGSVIIAVAFAFDTRLWTFARASFARVAPLLKFGAFAATSGFIWMASYRALFLFVGHYFGSSALAYLGIAQRMVDTPRDVLALAGGRYGLTALSRRQAEPVGFATEFQKLTNVFTLVTLPAFCALLILPDVVIALLVGERWLPAQPFVQVLAIAALVHLHSFMTPIAVNALGQPERTMRVSVYTTFATVVIMFAVGTQSSLLALWVWVARGLMGYVGSAYALAAISYVGPVLQLRSCVRSAILAIASASLIYSARWLFTQVM